MRGVPTLTRDGVVAAALDLAGESGLEAVTMHALGRRLGVTPMALYRHVGPHAELLRLVADRVGARIDPPMPPELPWDERARAWATTQRRVLRRYPGVAAWLIANGPTGPQAYRLLELLAAALVDGGLSDTETARGAALIMSWTFSRVVVEDNADRRRATPGRSEQFLEGLGRVDAATHPTASRVGPEFFTLPMEEIFRTGLDSILVGLRTEARTRTGTPPVPGSG
jgi:AcrR family transcriptional regulator